MKKHTVLSWLTTCILAVMLIGCGGGGAQNQQLTATSTSSGAVAAAETSPSPFSPALALLAPSTALKSVVLRSTTDKKLTWVSTATTIVNEPLDVNRHDVLVADAVTVPNAADDPNVAAFLAAGKTVVFFNVTDSIKSAILSKQAKIASPGSSDLFAVRRSLDAFGRPEIFVFDWSASLADVNPPNTFQVPFTTWLKKTPASVADSGFTPPDYLIYITFNYTINPQFYFSWSTTAAGAFKYNVPQVNSVDNNYRFRLFLENSRNSFGDDQILAVENAIRASPYNAAAGTNGMLAQSPGGTFSTSNMGWFQIKIGTGIQPVNQGSFNWIADSPPNTNKVTEVTSSLDFSVLFATPEGGGGAGFDYSTSKTQDLTSWLVNNLGGGQIGMWEYLNQDPFMANDVSRWNQSGFGGAYTDAFSSSYRVPNDLARSELQCDTQIAWATAGLDRSVEQFKCTLITHYANAWDRAFDFNGRTEGDHHHIDKQSYEFGINIDMASVVPVPIASLTFSPNPANSNTVTRVTGMVTLVSPAPIDTVVRLSSDNTSASVLPTMIIPQGQTSASFQVLVNSNGLVPGQQVVANIKAFYAQSYQAQLTITR